MSRKNYLFTSESVSEGHPDKVCDQISDAILDAFLANDIKLGIEDDSLSNTRLGCETLTTTNKIVIAGEVPRSGAAVQEVTARAVINREQLTEIARDVVKDIGYDQDGFSFHGADVEVLLHGQSPDIAMGVDAKKKKGGEEEGAGDQGMMFGLPAPRAKSTRRARTCRPRSSSRTRFCARSVGQAPLEAVDLQPDAKSQVTVQYVNGKAVGCTKVVVSTQHNAKNRNGKKYTPGMVKDLIGSAVESSLPKGWMPKQGVRLPRQPDRQLRGRRSGRRLRPHRPQDHRRHLRRLRAARRRRVLRQGPDQGRSLGGLRDALSRQERRRGRPRRALHHPGRLRDRRRRSDVAPG